MGYIKEPDEVVFHVINKKLTKKQEDVITDFIEKSKKKKLAIKTPKKILK